MKWYDYIIIIIIFLLIGWFATTGVKSQIVRLIDIFIYGPFLVWVAIYIENIWLKILLLFLGATTISYNFRNYLLYNDNSFVKNSSVTHPASWK